MGAEGPAGGPIALSIRPYHVNVPSFGEWGFVLASPGETRPTISSDMPLRFLNEDALEAMFRMPVDFKPRSVQVNRLGTAVLARYYAQGYRNWNGP